MASTQGEKKFVRQQDKYSSIEKKELGELDKNARSPSPFQSNPLKDKNEIKG